MVSAGTITSSPGPRPRLATASCSAAVPLLVIFGEEDQLYDDPAAAAQAYGDVPGARITIIPGAGHSPNVEKPARTARLVLRFAAGGE